MSQSEGMTGASPDAIELLIADHRVVDQLFKQYSAAVNDAGIANYTAEQIVRELSIHAVIEEQVLYPMVRRSLPDGEKLADRALKEHQEVKELLAQVDGRDANDPQVRTTMGRIQQAVTDHVEEEETDLFPKLRKHCDQESLQKMGQALAGAKAIAPTRPHPKAPNKPPANIVVGLGAAVIDRVRDAAKSIMER